MKARILQDNSFGEIFKDSFLQLNADKIIGGQLVSEWTVTDILPDISIVKPYWDGKDWIENATTAEIYAYKAPYYEAETIKRYEYLMLRSLSSSMGKYGTYEYLQIQRDEYELKYNVAKGALVNAYIADAIEKEMYRDFSDAILTQLLTEYGITPAITQIEKMYQLIIFRYETAYSKYMLFKSYCIDFRTKCRTFIELSEWSKLDFAFNLADTLPDDASELDIQNFYTSFDAL